MAEDHRPRIIQGPFPGYENRWTPNTRVGGEWYGVRVENSYKTTQEENSQGHITSIVLLATPTSQVELTLVE